MGEKKYDSFIPDTYPLNGLKGDSSSSERINKNEYLFNKKTVEKKEDMVVVWQEHV